MSHESLLSREVFEWNQLPLVGESDGTQTPQREVSDFRRREMKSNTAKKRDISKSDNEGPELDRRQKNRFGEVYIPLREGVCVRACRREGSRESDRGPPVTEQRIKFSSNDLLVYPSFSINSSCARDVVGIKSNVSC